MLIFRTNHGAQDNAGSEVDVERSVVYLFWSNAHLSTTALRSLRKWRQSDASVSSLAQHSAKFCIGIFYTSPMSTPLSDTDLDPHLDVRMCVHTFLVFDEIGIGVEVGAGIAGRHM